jgi:hypothetical protein
MFCCNICGATTGVISSDPAIQWLNYIRAIYITQKDFLHPQLSGIGYIQYPTDAILVHKTYEVIDSQLPQEAVNVEIHSAVPIAQSDGTLHPAAYTTGFVVHRNCYQLLEWACSPEPLNIKTLNLFLRSFDVLTHGQLADWGHGYGGLHANFDSVSRTAHTQNGPAGCVLGRDIWKGNPLLSEDECLMSRLTARTHTLDSGHNETGTIPPQNRSKNSSSLIASQSPLEKLPAELLDHILTFLPSTAILSARLASRVLACLRLSKAFWRSRFARGAEYECVIEPWLYKSGTIFERRFADPRVVYETLKSEKGSPILENRRRVWELVGPLSDALVSFAGHEKKFGSVSPCGEPLEFDAWTAGWDYTHCSPKKNSHFQPYPFGSLPCFKRYVALPHPVALVKVSVLRFHTTTYITGLRFCFTNGEEAAIGYVLPDCEIALATGGELRGFEVATGERGIPGIGVIGKCGVRMGTAGEMEGKSMQILGCRDRFAGLKAEIDVSCDLSSMCCSKLIC